METMTDAEKIEDTYRMLKEIYEFLIPLKMMMESGLMPGMPVSGGKVPGILPWKD